jgi:hypothetical protein
MKRELSVKKEKSTFEAKVLFSFLTLNSFFILIYLYSTPLTVTLNPNPNDLQWLDSEREGTGFWAGRMT